MASQASGSFSLPSETGQVKTWVLYELRGATRAECFFILHWGHNTLSFPGKCVNVCECVLCVSVPGLLLHAQQLLLLAPCILRLLTPPLLLLPTLDFPPPSRSVNSSAVFHSSPNSAFLSNPALSLALVLSLCLSLSIRIVAQLSGDSSVEVQWSGDYTVALSCCDPALLLSPRETELQVCVARCNHSPHLFPSSPSSRTHLLLPSSSFAPQISSFVWKVTKQPGIIMLC